MELELELQGGGGRGVHVDVRSCALNAKEFCSFALLRDIILYMGGQWRLKESKLNENIVMQPLGTFHICSVQIALKVLPVEISCWI